MQATIQSRALGRQRYPRRESLLGSDSRLITLTAAVFAASFLVSLIVYNKGANPITHLPVSGQALRVQKFAQERGYVRYRVTGTGKRYWYQSLAQRFGLERWQSIAEATLKKQTKINDSEIIDCQYRVELGMEIRVPLSR